MEKTIFVANDGIYLDGILISEPVKVPNPDLEAVRIYWDEETQSVKQEIIPLADMYEQPTNKSGDEK